MDKIKKEDIFAAIREIKANPLLRKGRASSTYDLIYEGKDYPPKLVISIANKYATGTELDASEFYGGPNKPAFDLLKKEGFTIVKKSESMNFKIVNEYISKLRSGEIQAAQSIKSLIETKNFESNLSVLDQIFFNNKLQEINSNNYIDTISFIKEIHKIKSGEYNDFNVWSASKTLLRKIDEKLIDRHDQLNKEVGFPDNGNGLYKSFLGENNLIAFIMKKYENQDNKFLLFEETNTDSIQKSFNYKTFHQYTKEAGLIFSEKIVARFVASLCTKPFVICSGLSGSGKTKLAQAFVQWISQSNQQYKIVPVGADWTNREPLVGYPNGLMPKEYITPDSGVIHLLMEAIKEGNENKPFFIILDEMNLSHVERYFADFLSIMESNDSIKLYTGDRRESLDGLKIPFEIGWPKNVFIIGTVNIDETTYMFSPKVLDRANVIEFRITEEEIATYLANPTSPKLDNLKGKGARMAKSFLDISSVTDLEKNDAIATELVSFFIQLKTVGAEFGYRSATEIMQLAAKLKILESSTSNNDCLDIAIMQKLLPKLHGSRSKLVKILIALSGLCVEGITKEEFEKKFEDLYKIGFEGLTIKYPISFEKLIRMYKNVLANGFTSYAEA